MLTGGHPSRSKKPSFYARHRCFCLTSIFSSAGLTLAIIAALLVIFVVPRGPSPLPPRNLIIVIPDGFGVGHHALTREVFTLPFLDDVIAGSIQTKSLSSIVTDSAASGTAYATGRKTNNGRIAMMPDSSLRATILEAAMLSGMRTGVVVTTPVPHATPAAFTAHHYDRGNMDNIAKQQIMAPKGGSGRFDILFGGGTDNFNASKRADHLDLIGYAQSHFGYSVALDKSSLESITSLPALGLFAPANMDYVIDRDPLGPQPSLLDMTRKALSLITAPSNNASASGFALMVECSLIDYCGHNNDAACIAREAKECDDVIGLILAEAERLGNTLVIVSPDHETGGLALARYGSAAWHPSVIPAVKTSLLRLSTRIVAGDVPLTPDALLPLLGFPVTPAQITTLNATLPSATDLMFALSRLVQDQAGVSFSSGVHSQADPFFFTNMPELLAGIPTGRKPRVRSLDNTELVQIPAKWLGLNLDTATPQIEAYYHQWNYDVSNLKSSGQDPYH